MQAKNLKHLTCITGCETAGKHAELIRHGFKYNTWKRNPVRFAKEGNYRHISIMMTISNPTLFSITDFLDDMIDLKKDSLATKHCSYDIEYIKILVFKVLRCYQITLSKNVFKHLTGWLEAFGSFITDSEKAHIQRLISIPQKIDRAIEDTDTIEDKHADFVNFTRYTQNVEILILLKL